MRLPVIVELDSRDGTSNKDSRLTNMLVEQDSDVKLAVLRPGLETVVTASGAGNGVTNFNSVLVSVYGTTLGFGTTPTTIGTVSGTTFDFAQSPL